MNKTIINTLVVVLILLITLPTVQAVGHNTISYANGYTVPASDQNVTTYYRSVVSNGYNHYGFKVFWVRASGYFTFKFINGSWKCTEVNITSDYGVYPLWKKLIYKDRWINNYMGGALGFGEGCIVAEARFKDISQHYDNGFVQLTVYPSGSYIAQTDFIYFPIDMSLLEYWKSIRTGRI